MEINMKSIHNKLLIIQKSVDKFVQDGQAHGYKYTTGSTVLNRIRPLMNEHKLLLNQEVTNIVNNRMDYTLKNGNSKSEILTTIEIRFTWVDCESGETLVSHFAANGQNDWDKGLGSALTYARRYGLAAACGISQTDDDGNDACAKPAPSPQPKPAPKPQQRETAQDERDLITNAGGPTFSVGGSKQMQALVESDEPYEYPKHRDLVVEAASQLKISKPRIAAHRDQLNAFLATAAYGNLESIKQAMQTYFAEDKK
jgi:hypothetical protein